VDWIRLAQDKEKAAGSHESGNEILNPVKFREIHEYLSDAQQQL
jgi:hypothetical protein